MSKAAELAALIGSQTALSNRNMIINGSMAISQRGTSFSSLSAGAYTCDRWQLQVAGAGRGTVTQESSGGPAGFKDNFLRVTVATADSSVASSDMQVLKQVIEGHVAAFTDAGTSDAKPLTLSFYVRSSVTGTFSATLYTNFNNPSAASYPAEYTISSANTWEQKTITYPAFTTSSTLATSGYTTGEFYQVRFALMSGSDKTGTANQWNSANDFASTNQTNLFATSSATWDIVGVQLELGEQATPFEHRSFADELQRCKRYFQTYNEPPARGTTSGGSTDRMAFMLPVTMRAAPSVTMSGTLNWYDGAAVGTITGLSATYTEPHSVEFDSTSFASGSSSATRSMVIYNASADGALSMDAEL